VLLQRLAAAGGSLADRAPQVLELSLAADPRSAAEARHALAGYNRAQAVPAGMADAGVLAISELVTNAVLHAQTPVLVWAEYDAEHLTIAVLDGSPALPVMSPLDDGNREGGRGMAIIDLLGATWGLVKTNLGKVVWVDLAPTAPVPDQRTEADRP
jgi:anti-sigma regulatory factor (Ser/Thr protein kinase)